MEILRAENHKQIGNEWDLKSKEKTSNSASVNVYTTMKSAQAGMRVSDLISTSQNS